MFRRTRAPLNRARAATPGRTAAAVALVFLVPLVGACTSDDPAPDPAPEREDTLPDPEAPTSATLTTRVVSVQGPPKQQRQRGRLAESVGAVLEEYVDAAFLGGFPRDDFSDAFATFTPGLARRAQRDADFLTGSRYAEAETVRATALRARLSALAPDTGPAGVTAYVRFEMDADGATWVYRGRLLLTPRGDSFRIFGYDMKVVQG